MRNASSALALRLGCLVVLLVALFVSSFTNAAEVEQSFHAVDTPEDPASKVLHESPLPPNLPLSLRFIIIIFFCLFLLDPRAGASPRCGWEWNRHARYTVFELYRVCGMSLSLTFYCQVMTMMTMTTGRMNTWNGSSKPWSCSPPSLLLVLSSPVGCTEEGYSLKGANTLRCNMSPPLQ